MNAVTDWFKAVLLITIILVLLTFGGVLITGAMIAGCAIFVVALVYDIGLGLFSLLRRGVLRLGRRERGG